MENDIQELSFLKIGRVRYIISKNHKEKHCQICGKKRKTTAHHIIPKRLRCTCPLLAEIRVRVCSECNDWFHPENKLIKVNDVIQKQSKYISNLKNTIMELKNKVNNNKEVGIDEKQL